MLKEARDLETVKDNISKGIDKHKANILKLKSETEIAKNAIVSERTKNEYAIKRLHELESVENTHLSQI